MSEYQYYEFRAIDQPLDKRAMTALRKITSRAEITSTSLTNEYHWGDFKGDPHKLMEKYFDAFLYFANWGTHRLMFRVPSASLGLQTVKAYCVPDRVHAWQHGEYLLLDFVSAEDCHEDEWRDGNLGSLVTLRDDLIAGDLRCLYLAWLSAVNYGDVEDDAVEPPIPGGLQTLSGPLIELADFLYLEEDLIEAAAESSDAALPDLSADEMEAWIGKLPAKEKDDRLLQIVTGDAGRVKAAMLMQFRQDFKSPKKTKATSKPFRTAGVLRATIEARGSAK